jgi:hypothetical protein
VCCGERLEGRPREHSGVDAPHPGGVHRRHPCHPDIGRQARAGASTDHGMDHRHRRSARHLDPGARTTLPAAAAAHRQPSRPGALRLTRRIHQLCRTRRGRGAGRNRLRPGIVARPAAPARRRHPDAGDRGDPRGHLPAVRDRPIRRARAGTYHHDCHHRCLRACERVGTHGWDRLGSGLRRRSRRGRPPGPDRRSAATCVLPDPGGHAPAPVAGGHRHRDAHGDGVHRSRQRSGRRLPARTRVPASRAHGGYRDGPRDHAHVVPRTHGRVHAVPLHAVHRFLPGRAEGQALPNGGPLGRLPPRHRRPCRNGGGPRDGGPDHAPGGPGGARPAGDAGRRRPRRCQRAPTPGARGGVRDRLVAAVASRARSHVLGCGPGNGLCTSTGAARVGPFHRQCLEDLQASASEHARSVRRRSGQADDWAVHQREAHHTWRTPAPPPRTTSSATLGP